MQENQPPDIDKRRPSDERDRRYAQQMAEQTGWPIGDTDSSGGTPEPTEDVGTSIAPDAERHPGGPDLGAGLGQTRGNSRKGPRGQITGVGGTRGSGGGTGHIETP
jgi:hypothetical protein